MHECAMGSRVARLLADVHDYAQLAIARGIEIVRRDYPDDKILGYYEGYEQGRAQGWKDESRLTLALLRDDEAIWQAIQAEAVIPGEVRARGELYTNIEATLRSLCDKLSSEDHERVKEELHALSQIALLLDGDTRLGGARNAREQFAMRRKERSDG